MPYSTFTWSIPGTAADATELRNRLNELGAALGYVTRRGPSPGRGGGVYVARDLAEGRAAVLAVEDAAARAWLASALLDLAAEHPDRADVLRRAVEGLRLADEFERRGPLGVRDVPEPV